MKKLISLCGVMIAVVVFGLSPLNPTRPVPAIAQDQILPTSVFTRTLLPLADAAAWRSSLGVTASSQVYLPSSYGTAGPAATGAQNRTAIQAAIDAANTAGGGTVWIGDGVWNLDKAGSADPYSSSWDYCLHLKKNVNLEGTGTLRIANSQLVSSPSVRQLAIVSMGSASTAATAGNNRIVGLTFDGNPKNQGGYSTYAQLGATSAIRVSPGVNATEVMSDLHFERLTCKDFFGNPANIGTGASQFIQRVTCRDVTCYRCGEGWQLIRCQYVFTSNVRYVDDNPLTLQGVGTGYVTAGDCHEYAECRDVVIQGVSVDCLGASGSGAGSGLDLYESVRVKVFGGNIRWSSGIECGFPNVSGTQGCNEIVISGVRCENPTPANDASPGIDCCPNLTLHACEIINHGIPLRLGAGVRPVSGTGCIVNATDVRITGGGGNQQAMVILEKGSILRATNLQATTGVTSVRGITVSDQGALGTSADTRIELTGGKISCPGTGLLLDGNGSTNWSPTGFVVGTDFSACNAGSWPVTSQNLALYQNIEISNIQPKTATNINNVAGAEVFQSNAAVTAIPNGSKNQTLRVQLLTASSPITSNPSAAVAFGATSGSNRLVVNSGTTVLASGDSITVRRNDAGDWDQIAISRVLIGESQHVMTFSFADITAGQTLISTAVTLPNWGTLESMSVVANQASGSVTSSGANALSAELQVDGSALITTTLGSGDNFGNFRINRPSNFRQDLRGPDTRYRVQLTAPAGYTDSSGANPMPITVVAVWRVAN